MSLRRLPSIENLERPEDDADGFDYFGDREFKEWRNSSALAMVEAQAGTVIDILSPIGKNPFTGEGVNAQDVSRILKGATGEVTVNINSPGGSYFEGLAIYTLLKNHPHKVTVNIIGTAASAASLIASSGDLRRISAAGSVMIHNAHAGVQGDRHDLADGAEALGEIDGALRKIYAAVSGQTDAKLDQMMTPSIGTWMFGQDAVDKGFADELIAAEKITEDKSKRNADAKTRGARAQLDSILCKAGMSRSQRREFMRDVALSHLNVPEQDVDTTPTLAQIADMIRNIGKKAA